MAAVVTALGLLALVAPAASPAAAAPATAMVNLGAAATYAVLSGTSVGNTVNAPTAPHTTLRGDLGVSAPTEPTGFPPGIVLGTKRVGATAAPAVTNLVTAYDSIVARPGGEPLAGDLAGKTLTPGLHANVGAVANTGTVILDGLNDPNSVFVFKVNGALAMAALSHVTLTNGAQASRVFWQVNGAASVGANSTFAGTILANAAIAMGAGTMVNGRALTSAGAITLDSNEFYSIPPVVTITGGADAMSADPTPSISGTTNIVAPAVVTVTVNGQTLTAAPAADGSWTVTSDLLANAIYPVVASVSDPAGNFGRATQSLTIDTVLPLVTIDGGDAVTTNDFTPTISGTTDVAVGRTVSVSVPPQNLTALVQGGGTWNVTPSPLADGVRTVTATVTDPAGNNGSASQTLSIDTVGPAVTITGGASALTNDGTPTITGTADVLTGRTVTVTLADQTLTGLVQADRSWSITSIAVLSDGPHLVTMSVSDVAGNSSSTTQTLTVDTAPPAITISGGATAFTNDLTPTISGTTAAVPGTIVTVTIAGQTMTTLVQANGSWNTTPSPVSEGALTVVASVPDPAGNVGSATQVLTVDVAGPVVTINGGASAASSDTTPTLRGTSTDVAVGSTVTITVAGQTLTTTMQPGGTWSVTPAVLSYATHFVVVTVTDPSGNRGSATQALTIDADADAMIGVAVYRPSTGVWYERSPFYAVHWGETDDVPLPADYDGNGSIEQAVYRPSTGVWYLLGPPYTATHWGEIGDVPVPADYDGNGSTDVAVYRPATGVWYVQSPFQAVKWGEPEDIPIPGDYNGDGSTEFAVYRPSTGVWYLLGPPFSATVWGEPGDIPVVGDYDGNGTSDLAVYRPSTGVWYVRSPFQAAQWGEPGDVPVPGDYDGNGSTEFAVYRPATGVWYLYGPPFRATHWGEPGDIPLPLPQAVYRRFF